MFGALMLLMSDQDLGQYIRLGSVISLLDLQTNLLQPENAAHLCKCELWLLNKKVLKKKSQFDFGFQKTCIVYNLKTVGSVFAVVTGKLRLTGCSKHVLMLLLGSFGLGIPIPDQFSQSRDSGLGNF